MGFAYVYEKMQLIVKFRAIQLTARYCEILGYN